MKIAGPSLIKYNPEKACFEVVEKAVKLFKEKENRIDDITINIIILWIIIIINILIIITDNNIIQFYRE